MSIRRQIEIAKEALRRAPGWIRGDAIRGKADSPRRRERSSKCSEPDYETLGDWSAGVPYGDRHTWSRRIRVPFVPGWYWLRRTDAPSTYCYPAHISSIAVWNRLYERAYEVAGPIPEPSES